MKIPTISPNTTPTLRKEKSLSRSIWSIKTQNFWTSSILAIYPTIDMFLTTILPLMRRKSTNLFSITLSKTLVLRWAPITYNFATNLSFKRSISFLLIQASPNQLRKTKNPPKLMHKNTTLN